MNDGNDDTWPVSKPRLPNLVRLSRPDTVCSCRAAVYKQQAHQSWQAV